MPAYYATLAMYHNTKMYGAHAMPDCDLQPQNAMLPDSAAHTV